MQLYPVAHKGVNILFVVWTGPMQQNGLDPTVSEIQKVQNHIQQREYKVKAMATVSLKTAYVSWNNISATLKVFFKVHFWKKNYNWTEEKQQKICQAQTEYSLAVHFFNK